MACVAHSENLLNYIGEISSVDECRQLCIDEKDCQYLTYYGASSFPIHKACYLLKNCDDRVCFIAIPSSIILIYLQFSGGLRALRFRVKTLFRSVVQSPLHWKD